MTLYVYKFNIFSHSLCINYFILDLLVRNQAKRISEFFCMSKESHLDLQDDPISGFPVPRPAAVGPESTLDWNAMTGRKTPLSSPASFLGSSLAKSPKKSKARLQELAQEILARVKEKRTTTFPEVANHLIAERNTGKKGLTDGKIKSIRRRVYDALNVLLATGVIAKEKKHIRWVGFPDGTESKEEARLLQEKTELLETIKQSQSELDEIRNQIKIYHTLITRNELIDPHDPSIQSSLLFLPFLTLTIPQQEIGISIDDDYTQYWLDVPFHFEIRDDSAVLNLIHKCTHH